MIKVLSIMFRCKILGGRLRGLFYRYSFKGVTKLGRIGKIGLLWGTEYISIGDGTVLGDYIYLTAWNKGYREPELRIGSRCEFGIMNHISCCNRIIIGNNVLTGKWVTITDNSHGLTTVDDMQIPPAERQIVSKDAVEIGDNVWIGDKATILPGVKIGEGSIIGANSVVTRDVPSYSVVCGNPAIIVKQLL